MQLGMPTLIFFTVNEMNTDIPENAVKYSESPVFTEVSIPDSLQRDHSTKPSVWGQIVVSSGALIYTRCNKPSQTIAAGETAIIHPEEPHNVAPKGAVNFKVEFYRVPKTEVAQ